MIANVATDIARFIHVIFSSSQSLYFSNREYLVSLLAIHLMTTKLMSSEIPVPRANMMSSPSIIRLSQSDFTFFCGLYFSETVSEVSTTLCPIFFNMFT